MDAMAPTAEQAPRTQEQAQNLNPRPHNNNLAGRRGRGRGGFRNNLNQSISNQASADNRTGGHGRGSRTYNLRRGGGSHPFIESEQPAPPVQPPPGLGGGGTFGVHPTKDADPTEGEVASQQQGAEAEEDSEVCFICASPVMHTSIAPCNHRTCHICALRLRALYKTRACAHCRVRIVLPFDPCTDTAY